MTINLTNFEYIDKGILLKFDRDFNHIKYIKLESKKFDLRDIKSESCKLDFERNEIKYSKKKDNLLLFTQETQDISTFVIIIIEEVDYKECYYSHLICNQSQLISNKNASNNTSNNANKQDLTEELLAKGMSMLLKDKMVDKMVDKGGIDKLTINKKKIDCPIKNENIFAQVSKKR